MLKRNIFKRLQIIKDMHEEIRLEKYNTERQMLLDEREAEMRKVQLEKTQIALHDCKSRFMEYVAAAEGEENVRIAAFSFSSKKM